MCVCSFRPENMISEHDNSTDIQCSFIKFVGKIHLGILLVGANGLPWLSRSSQDMITYNDLTVSSKNTVTTCMMGTPCSTKIADTYSLMILLVISQTFTDVESQGFVDNFKIVLFYISFLTLGLFGRRVIVVTCVCPSVRLSVCLSVCSHHPC